MNVRTSIIWWIKEELKKKRYEWQLWTPLAKLGASVLTREGTSVVLIDGITTPPPSKCKGREVEDYFNKLKKALEKLHENHPITDVVFRGGGTEPVPKWFSDWCKEKRISIHVVEDSGEYLSDSVGGEGAPWVIGTKPDDTLDGPVDE